MEQNKFLKDIAFLPALHDDYGYYLIKKDIGFMLHNDEACDDGFRDVLPFQRTISDVSLTDKKLGLVSCIDFLHWEGNKYRIYIDALRLSRLGGVCPDLFFFIGKLALANASKSGFAEWIHCDYAIVGTDRVYRATEKERRQDVRMAHRVRAIISGRGYLDAAGSLGALFPNLKANYEGVFQLDEKEKKTYHEVCDTIRDVSVVWQCGMKRRRLLRERKIYRWDDPAFQDNFYGMVSSPLRVEVIRKMLSLSLEGTDDLMFPPKETIVGKFPILQKGIGSWVFVDFETDYQKCIYLLGYYTEKEGYQCEWADHLDPCSEKPLMRKTHQILSAYKEKGFVLCYYVAEMNFWKERCRFHNMQECADLFDGMVDLSHVFIYGPLIIRNVFNFKLKNIALKMKEMGYIGVKQPEGCLDGAQSVDIAKEYFQTRSTELSTILEKYNQFDCQVLYELVVFLQKYYYLE